MTDRDWMPSEEEIESWLDEEEDPQWSGNPHGFVLAALARFADPEIERLRAQLVGAHRRASPPLDAACSLCVAEHRLTDTLVIDGFVCWWHEGRAIAALEPGDIGKEG